MGKRQGGHALTSLIQKADIFHGPIYLNVRGRDTIATTLGGLLSLVLVLIVLAQFSTQVQQMYYHSNPTILQMSEFYDNPSSIGLNETNNFMFAVSTTVDGKFINMTAESLFTFHAAFNQYFRDSEGNRTKILSKVYFAPCNATDFPPPLPNSTYQTFNLMYAYCPVSINFTMPDGTCPDFIKDEYEDCIGPPHFNISGTYLSSAFEFIQFNVSICEEDAEEPYRPFKVTCDTMENIDKHFQKSQIKWNLYYANNLLNPIIYTPPNKTFFDSMYWDIVRNDFKVADIFLDQQTIMNHDSFYSETQCDNHTFYNIDPSKNREQGSKNNGDFPVLQWNLRRSSFNLVTIRTYTKIQDVLANIGGFSKSIIFAFTIIAAGYVRFKYQMMLSNELYSFQSPPPGHGNDSISYYSGDDEDGSGRRKSKNASISMQHKLLNDEDIYNQAQNNNLSPNQGEDAAKEFFDKEKKVQRRMKYNELKYFFRKFLCCLKRPSYDDKLAAKSREYVENDIDIINLVQKIQDVDKLKMVLLTSDQRQLFNYVPKPLVTLESEKAVNRDASFMHHEPMENYLNDIDGPRADHERVLKYSKLFMSYRRISRDFDVGRMNANKRLLNLMGEDLIKIFQKIEREVGEEPDPRHLQAVLMRCIQKEKKNQ